MPRLSNVKSGAIVSVPEEHVARLGSDWVRIDAPETAPAPVEPEPPTDLEIPTDLETLTVAELNDEIDRLNRGLDPDNQIVPASAKKADLIAALAITGDQQ